MNESIQEDIKGIRVVKSYVRDEYENKNSKRRPMTCVMTSSKVKR